MIKFENVKVTGFDEAVKAMRMYNNSTAKSDSYATHIEDPQTLETSEYQFFVGEKDKNLLSCFADCGRSHCRVLKYIDVSADICAPIYWWTEFFSNDFKVDTNDFSIMYKFRDKPFDISDFSTEHLFTKSPIDIAGSDAYGKSSYEELWEIVDILNYYRDKYVNAMNAEDRSNYRWQMMQLLPASYNQTKHVKLNYYVLKQVYELFSIAPSNEWNDILEWIKGLPHSDLITGINKED